MIPKIGFSLQKRYDRPLPQVVELLKNAGFSAVSPLWSPEIDLSEVVDAAHKNGMTIQSIHAPHKGVAQLWTPEVAPPSDLERNFLATIDACAQFEAPIMVLHSWQGFDYTFREDQLDFRLFDDIVAYAQQKGVSVAFENLEGEEYLGALMNRYRNCPHVGFCWDSGHENCYPHKADCLKAFGHRLIMTHLHDNFGLRDPISGPTGIDDLHFIPYDGNIDWDHALQRLSAAPKQEILNFELKVKAASDAEADLIYLHQPLAQFIETAATRAKQIAQKYSEIT